MIKAEGVEAGAGDDGRRAVGAPIQNHHGRDLDLWEGGQGSAGCALDRGQAPVDQLLFVARRHHDEHPVDSRPVTELRCHTSVVPGWRRSHAGLPATCSTAVRA